jgi:hydroxymethylglutaryl-CoA reductase
MHSRIPDFYTEDRGTRLETVADRCDLTEDQVAALDADGETAAVVDALSENVVGSIALPVGVATNFVVDGEDRLVPMAVEESSVVAAASKGAKLARHAGGFTTDVTGQIMVGQVQVVDVPDPEAARVRVLDRAEAIVETANDQGVLVSHGGGCRDVTARIVDTVQGPMVAVHLHVDTADAMGANAVNTMVEGVAPLVADATGGEVSLRVLSNLADRRLARAHCRVAPESLVDGDDDRAGETVRDRIVEARAFADADEYRAATHNKGVMNAVDALAVATGNDWRALEAGAHAYAALGGYSALTTYEVGDDGALVCAVELPVQVGTVGGATAVHPTARAAIEILDVDGARELAGTFAALGLAENLASLRALVGEGIQEGHMKLHAENVARQADVPADLVEEVAARMVAEGDVRESRARELVGELA